MSNCMLKEDTGRWETPVMLDAPVSGGVPAAEAATLTFMVEFFLFHFGILVKKEKQLFGVRKV